MSASQWFWIIFGAEGVVIAVALWYGLRAQVNRFGCFVQRAEWVVEDGKNVAIQFRACVAALHDLGHTKHHDHPVVPPDILPDPLQERERIA